MNTSLFSLIKNAPKQYGNHDYLYSKLKTSQKESGENRYYNTFLKTLFFEGFAQPENMRSASANKLLGKVKYLNGGLFLKHKIEEEYPDIFIPDVEINPDVLGYIFEKYINQKAFIV